MESIAHKSGLYKTISSCDSPSHMPLAGLEPARCYPLDFESSASANSATAASVLSHIDYDIIFRK